MSPEEKPASGGLARRLSLRISDDGLEAYALVMAGEQQAADASAVGAVLAAGGIIEGVLPAAVAQLAKSISTSGEATREIVVARGRPPQNGADGEVTYCFSTGLAAGKEDEAGRMDYRERGLVNNVDAGAVLATVRPAGEGVPGLSVRGREIRPGPGRPALLPRAGHNVEMAADGLSYVATIEGNASLTRGGTLQVSPELVIGGDLDFAAGNIDFGGNVTINGNVKSGFAVRAGGDISVRGDVENKARLCAGRSVVVRGAIRTGTDEPRVTAGHDVVAGSLEGACVKAGHKVVARTLALDSIVECFGRFFCERGEVRGSNIQAVAGMMVNNVGTEDGVANTLTVGLTRRVAARVRALDEKIKELQKAAEVVFYAFRKKYSDVLRDRSLREKMSPAERAEFEEEKKTASQRQETMTDEVGRLRAELEELRKELLEKPGATVVVTGTVHPSCTVYVRDESLVIRPGKPRERVVFFEKKDPPGVGSEPYDPARMASVGEENTYVGAGGSGETVEDPDGLCVRVKEGGINSADLAAELDRYAAAGPELAATAVRIANEAAREERYAKPAVLAAEAGAWLKVARASDADGCRKAAVRALTVCEKALGLDGSHPRAHSTAGRANYLLGRFNDSLAAHKRAVESVNRYSAEKNSAVVHYEFAETLRGIAEALAGKAPDKAADLWEQAVYQCEDYLSKEPNGAEVDACRQIVARGREALGTEGREGAAVQ